MQENRFGRGERDPRVDFFRGLAFIIIFIAHVPSNFWKSWIPARFGFSDATEMFVFMSGYAAAIAFGAVFMRRGLWLGTARVALRTWQVYTAHLTLFFFTLTVVVVGTFLANPGWGIDFLEIDRWADHDYIGGLNLWYFIDETPRALVGLITLTYVPNYFDILPMYLVLLAMMPIVVAFSRIRPWAGPAFCLALYVVTWTVGTGLPAEVRPDSDRVWFFNPFGWHLIFFTGFCIQLGWLRPPKRSVWLFAVCVLFIVFAAVISNNRFIFNPAASTLTDLDVRAATLSFDDPETLEPDQTERLAGAMERLEALAPEDRARADAALSRLEILDTVRDELRPMRNKTDLGLLRYLHFLALAYVTVYLLYGRERLLLTWIGRPIAQCGRQSLPVFMFSMILSRIGGMALDIVGRDDLGLAIVNLGGIGLLIAFAYLLAWLKAEPWRKPKPKPVAAQPEPA